MADEVSDVSKIKVIKSNILVKKHAETLQSHMEHEHLKWKREHKRQAQKMTERLERLGRESLRHVDRKDSGDSPSSQNKGLVNSKESRLTGARRIASECKQPPQENPTEHERTLTEFEGLLSEVGPGSRNRISNQQVSGKGNIPGESELQKTGENQHSDKNDPSLDLTNSYIDRLRKSFDDIGLDKEVAGTMSPSSSLPNSPRLSRHDFRKMKSLNLSVDIKRMSGMKSDSPPVRSNALAIPGSNENGVSPATSRSPSPAPSAFLALPADRSPRSRSPSPSPRSRSDNDSHAKTTNGVDSSRQRRHGSEILPLYLNTSDTSPSRSPSLSRKISTSSLSSSPQGSLTPVPSKSPLLHRKALQEPNLKHSYDSLLPSNSSNTSLNLLSRQQRVLSRSLEVLNSDKDAVRVAKRSISTVSPPSLTPSALSPATSTSSLHFSRSGSLDRSIDGQTNTPPRHTPSSSPKTERRPSEWSDIRRRSSSWGTTRNKPTIVVENVTEKVPKIPMHKKHTAATRKKSIGPAHFFIQALDLQSPAESKVDEEQYPPMLLPPVYTQTTRQLTPRDFSIRPVTPTFTGEEMENMKGVRYLRTPNNGESDFIDPFDFSV